MNWERKIAEKSLKIGVVGLGYVGLPLAVEFAEKGFEVTGFDVNEDKVNQIKRGESPVSDIASGRLADLIERKNLRATIDMKLMEDLDSIHICVPTPLRKSRDPDISYIVRAVRTIAENFQPPGLITLESTTYPGTTDEVVAEAFEQEGWDLNKEILLVFSPERIDPANPQFGLKNTPKVIGGYNAEAARVGELVYGQVAGEVITVESTREAEMVKLLENTFRSINIGLANEMALVCDRLGINVWQVIDAAATKPFGFMPFYPGPGLGGHCIPIDPLFLSWRASLDNATTRFIELADEINRSMPEYVYRLVTDGLNRFCKSVRGSSIAVIGVAYKPEVSDTRESPAFHIVEQLLDGGATVKYCDPYVEQFVVRKQAVERFTLDQLSDENFDLALIITDHSLFDWEKIVVEFPLIVDTRNALEQISLLADTELIVL